MNYELALELKDSGFPNSEEWVENPTHESLYAGFDKYYPTLSELIHACKGGFQVLKHSGSLWLCYLNGGEWVEGYTPEEAVAKLWLKLNK